MSFLDYDPLDITDPCNPFAYAFFRDLMDDEEADKGDDWYDKFDDDDEWLYK